MCRFCGNLALQLIFAQLNLGGVKFLFIADFFLSKLHLRHVGAIAREEFALQDSSRVFVCMA